MNSKMIRYILSNILKLEAIFMIVPLLLSIYYQEKSSVFSAHLLTIFLLLGTSYLLSKKQPENTRIFAKEGLFIVAFSWLTLSFFGALPFVISREIPSFVDAFFEVVSGFTTTGATILSDVEALSHSLLYWRSFTHFVGGMGVLVLALAILPKNNNQSLHIMKAEVPGPTVGKLVSKMTYNSRILYLLYLFLTLIIIFFLCLGGMPLFDSVLHTFGTVGTGGFGVKNASIGYYHSAYIEYVLAIGMLLAGMNFNLFYALLLRNFKQVLHNEELKFYLSIATLAVLAICIDNYADYNSIEHLFRDSLFTVSSIMTTTGFSTVNFDTWSVFSKTILLVLMMIGGCAGSTAGGIKVSRFIVLFKTFIYEFKKTYSPNRVFRLKMDGRALSQELIMSIRTYLILYLSLFFLLLLCIAPESPDFISACSAVAATFNNIGPGFGMVGPTMNYSHFSSFSKIVLSFGMLLGRLEIFPILLIFSPEIFVPFFQRLAKIFRNIES
ncbi:MAG: TrkH family potassium uptake protein [Fusobacterium necrophorum]|nr:TrkH family potassium uptake protein [Fusobacterium necrophorum]MCI7681278.1 TrkH family potassium uptake protein [Fusobacterium necrophorum]MDY2572795.1 TrkH family potassium uptake protein [Fusobacterium necrophorum]MDY6173028.1 TrkH family potassium uptake protein [Fusobacterium necrophorum]